MVKVSFFDLFTKQSKRLCRKFKSLDSEIITLIDSLKSEPNKGVNWEAVFSKFGWQVIAKARVNQADFGL